jgi:PAS domain S-box-containing protein
MHHGSDLSVGQTSAKAEIDLHLLTDLTPFVVAMDENGVVTWASQAVLRRVPEAIGIHGTDLIEGRDPPGDLFSQVLSGERSRLCRVALCQGERKIPLVGRCLPCQNGSLVLATPDAKTGEDLPFFSLDDFPQENHLVELLATRDETRVSLRGAASAVTGLKEKNKELEASRRCLESINAALEHEVTECEKAEAGLRQSREQYRTMLRTIVDGFWIMDTEGRFLDVNDAYCHLTGYSREELLSMRIHEVEALETQDEMPQHIRRIIERGEDRFETRHRGKDGQIVEVEVSVNYGDFAGGQLFCFLRDITERKQAERQQVQLLQKLSEINQELKDFAYVVSHDLKAPLRAIKTLAEWLSTDYEDKLDEQGKENLRLLGSRVDRMHNLIDGVLQYSRIGRTEQGTMPVDLNRLVPDIIEDLGVPAHIAIHVESDLPTVEADATRITQVFQNLLSNAIKYMDKPQGNITVGCVEEDGLWKFSVADNGPGIERKDFERIFKLFQTLAPRDGNESTGVGLTVTKKIVEMYGGRIWVESEVGMDSTFFFTFPKQKEAAVPECLAAGAAP